MKLFSGILGLVVLLLALGFAVANRQSATISLWPFGVEIAAPLFLLTLGTFFVGLLLGAVLGWASALTYRLDAWRARRDIAALRDKVTEMQQTILPPRDIDADHRPSAPGAGWRFLKTRKTPQ